MWFNKERTFNNIQSIKPKEKTFSRSSLRSGNVGNRGEALLEIYITYDIYPENSSGIYKGKVI